MSARKSALPAKPVKRKYKRRGPPTDVEKELVARVVMDHPGPLSPKQERGLVLALNRSTGTVKEMIDKAKQNFIANADAYVNIHMASTVDAYTAGQFDVALKGSSWAMEHLTGEGSSIVEKATSAPSTGSKILIGIRVGGVDALQAPIALPVIEVKNEDA